MFLSRSSKIFRSTVNSFLLCIVITTINEKGATLVLDVDVFHPCFCSIQIHLKRVYQRWLNRWRTCQQSVLILHAAPPLPVASEVQLLDHGAQLVRVIGLEYFHHARLDIRHAGHQHPLLHRQDVCRVHGKVAQAKAQQHAGEIDGAWPRRP